jgi:hypothetical protein
MSSQSENLKVIVADAYFSFVPTFKEGDELNITLSRREATDEVVHDPIGHKTHRIVKMDWVMMIDEPSRNALATLVVSVEPISQQTNVSSVYPDVVATHS